MNQNEAVLHQFMILIEQIQNTANQSITFPCLDGAFFRGELHVLAIVGHEPGIYSSQIARCLHVSRTVTHKTVNRLVERGYLNKKRGDDNQKQWGLVLSETGEKVFMKHQETYQSAQSSLGNVLNSLSLEACLGIEQFLNAAREAINPSEPEK